MGSIHYSINPINALSLYLIFTLLPHSLLAQDFKKQPSDSSTNSGSRAAKRTTYLEAGDYPGYKKAKNTERHFNYFSLRLAYPVISDDFNNPIKPELTESRFFSYKTAVKPQYQCGLELGKAFHFVESGNPMIKFGLNIDFTAQMFAKGEAKTIDTAYDAIANGLYIGTFGVGPQITFCPIDIIRIGIYGRAGVSGVYNEYTNTQYVSGNPDLDSKYEMNIKMYNFAFNKDVGLDVTIKKLSVGVVWSFIKAAPLTGQFYAPDDNMANQFIRTYEEQAGSASYKTEQHPINPTINFNRFSVLLGFAF